MFECYRLNIMDYIRALYFKYYGDTDERNRLDIID